MMNKLYIPAQIILSVLLLFSANRAQCSTIEKTLVLYDLQLGPDGSVYEDTDFRITATHCTGGVISAPTVLECLFDNGSKENLGYIGLFDSQVNNTVNGGKAYIDIKYKGDYSVLDIEIIGFGDEGSATSSECKFYIGPNTISDLPFYEGADYSLSGGEMVERSMVFTSSNGLETACSNASACYEIPDEISLIDLDFSGGFPPVVTETPYTDIRKTIKDMRLEWTSVQYASLTKILGLRITYDVPGSSTGLDTDSVREPGFTYNGNTVLANEASLLQVYGLDGRLLLSGEPACGLCLSHLPPGIYIVKCRRLKDGASSVAKIHKR